jgi:hypothetical protein
MTDITAHSPRPLCPKKKADPNVSAFNDCLSGDYTLTLFVRSWPVSDGHV